MTGFGDRKAEKMNFQEILEKLKTKVEVVESKEDLGILNANVKAEDLVSAITFLKDELGFDHLNFTTAIDWVENNNIEAVYYLSSVKSRDRAVIRVKMDRKNPQVDSICGIFRTAEWHEREAFEMFGIVYNNHPDLRKLLLTDDIDKPLLKDFEHPEFEKLPKI